MKANNLLLFIALVWGCKQRPQKAFVPDSSGNIHTVTVVMPENDWQGKLGDAVREKFWQPYEGLPYDEPQFDLKFIPPKAFTGFAKQSRNLLWFVQDSTEKFSVSQNYFAKPQIVGIFQGRDPETHQFFWEENHEVLNRLFVEHERKEKIRRMQKSLSTETILSERFGFSLDYPSAYKTVKDTANFVWIEKPTSKGHNNILVYTLPNGTFNFKDPKQVLDIRDSIGKQYIPGRLPKSYQISERAYRPYYYQTQLAGNQAQLTKATWEVKNDFMAGPYVHFIFKDPKNEQWICIEGFAFAPNSPKRPAMFELETILRTFRWAD